LSYMYPMHLQIKINALTQENKTTKRSCCTYYIDDNFPKQII
jgi:hypothetical protein